MLSIGVYLCDSFMMFFILCLFISENGPWMIGENMTGSYFIQAFIHVFTNQAHGKSFLEMMEEVGFVLFTDNFIFY